MIKKIKRRNKKGAMVMQFLAMAIVIFLLFVLLMTVYSGPEIKLIGETQKNIVNVFEAGQRTFFYIDAATEISAKLALNETSNKGGYVADFVEGNKIYPSCGYVIGPVLNNDSRTFCIPDYKKTLEYNFKINLNDLLKKYTLFQINSQEFETIIETDGADIVIRTIGLSDINIPIYAYVESYYAGVNQEVSKNANPTQYKKDADGYLEREGLQSENRQGYSADKIVIYDTFTKDISQTYSELYSSGRNYNYVIGRDGQVYKFAAENKATHSKYCTDKDCGSINEKQIISIGMQSCSKDSTECPVVACYTGLGFKHTDACWDSYTDNQIIALDNLLADIAIRNTGIDISEKTVLGYNELDKTAKNPTPFFADKKATIIKDAQIVIQKRLKATNQNTNSAPKTTPIQGKAIAPPSPATILKSEPTYPSGIITSTVYYTPDCNDPTLKKNGWSSGATNSKGYCYIPKSQNGFYEEVKCEGSGSCDGHIYHHSTITKDETSSPYLTGVKNGRTATGSDPLAHRTAAVNNEKGTQCYIKYGTQFYAYFGEGNPWNGFYIAEDTGSAFKGKCKIDFYAGVGESNSKAASKWVNPQTSPEIYILDSNYDIAKPEFSSSISNTYTPQSLTGRYSTKYASRTILIGAEDFFNKAYNYLPSAVKTCYGKGQTRKEKENCLNAEFSKDTPLIIKTGNACYETNTLSFADIKNSETVQNIAGTLEKKSDVIYTPEPDTHGKVKTKSATLTLKNKDDEQIEVTLYSDAVKKLDSLNVGDYLILKETQRAPVLGIVTDKRAVYSEDQIIANPPDSEMKYLADFAQKLADCSTDNTVCECDVKYEGKQQFLNFKQNHISLGDFTDTDTVEISNKIAYKATNSLISDSLKYKIPSNGKVLFDKTKNGEFTIINKSDKNPACVPKQNYFYVCVQSSEDSLKGQILHATVKI